MSYLSSVEMLLSVRNANPQSAEVLRLHESKYFDQIPTRAIKKKDFLTMAINRSNGILLDAREIAGDWSQISRLKDLRFLDVSSTKISDDDLEFVKDRPLTFIAIHNCKNISGKGLQKLQHIKSLRTFLAEDSSIRDSDLVYLNPNIIDLNIANCSITDKGLEHVASLKNIQILVAGRNKISEKSIPFLESLKTLHYLDVRWCGGINNLAAVRSLTQVLPHTVVRFGKPQNFVNLAHAIAHSNGLSLNANKLSGDWSALSNLKDLQDLNLDAAKLHEQDLQYLSNLPLRFLNLDFCSAIHVDGMRALQNIKTLSIFRAIGSSIGDPELAFLSPNLREIEFSDCPITDTGAQHIASLDRLETVRLRGTKITAKSLTLFGKMKSLTSLDVRNCLGISLNDVLEFQREHPSIAIISNARNKAKSE